jgi:hypothetical protein
VDDTRPVEVRFPQGLREAAIRFFERAFVEAVARLHGVVELEIADVLVVFGLDHEDALADQARLFRVDGDDEQHRERVVERDGLDTDARPRKTMLSVVLGDALGDSVELCFRDVAAGRELRRAQRAGAVERPALDLDGAHRP